MKACPTNSRVCWERLIGCLAVLFLCGLSGGCLILPMNYHTAASRHNISLQTTNLLEIGITTKDEVLLKLGEPDFASPDEQRLGYLWSKVKCVWAIGGMGGGAAGEITRSYLVETSFDSSNRVSGVRALRRWGESAPATDRSPPSKGKT